LEGSQVSPVCPTGKRSTWINRSMEHWWNDIDRWIPETLGEDNVPVPLAPPIKLTWIGLVSNPGLCGERAATKRLRHGTAFKD